jgi:hypothetical protein
VTERQQTDIGKGRCFRQTFVMSSLGEGQLFGLAAVTCLGGFMVLVAIAIRSAKKWMAEFLRQARRLGWH